MIFVDRSLVAAPEELLNRDKDGLTELEKVTAFFAIVANREKTFTFKQYKEKPVVEALNLLFHGKCAYCESIATATQPVDVEHFRPKGGYNLNGQSKLQKPGYYWLAAMWDNLMPSCIDCNRERFQAQAAGVPSKKTGKGNNFPLEDEGVRATQPGEEAHEVPLLLNPCVDRPEEHLEFIDEGNIRARLAAAGQESRKGQVSIDVYGLRRMGLVLARQARAKEIRAQIELVSKLALVVQQNPNSANLKGILRDELARLKAFTADDQPYAGMARQIVEAFIDPLRKP
jgi:uncharacterized protein (TIGR02646 family)